MWLQKKTNDIVIIKIETYYKKYWRSALSKYLQKRIMLQKQRDLQCSRQNDFKIEFKAFSFGYHLCLDIFGF